MSSTVQANSQSVAGSATHQSTIAFDQSTIGMDGSTAVIASASPFFYASPSDLISNCQVAATSASLVATSASQPYVDDAASSFPSCQFSANELTIQQGCVPSDDDFLLSEMLDDHLLWMIPHSAASFLPLSAALSFPLLQQQEEQQQQQPEQFQNLLPEAPAFALNSTSFENGCFMSPSCQSSYSLAFPDSSAESAGSYAIPSIASPTTNPVFTVSPAQSFSSTILDQMITGLTIDSVAAAPQLPLAAAASFPSSSPPPGVPEEAATTLLSSVVAQQLTLADGDHNIFLQPWLEQQIIVQQQENDQGHITQQQQEQGRQRPEKQPNMTDNKKSLTESKGAASGAAKGNPSPVRRTRHICPFCTHSSNRANNMKEHIMTHYPNRPKAFKCHRCGKPFARKHDMKRHLKIHERRRTPRYPGTILFC